MRIKPVTRISLGLVSLTISLLLLGKIVGLAPDRTSAVVESRKTLSEALAIQFSAAAQHGDLVLIRETLESMVERENDVQSAAIRDGKGEIIAETGNHADHWKFPGVGKSTLTHIQIPVFKGEEQWATVEISFPPVWLNNILAGFRNSYLSLIFFIGLTGFAGYSLFIKRTLRELDPSKVIPDRVQAAFDVMNEGVLLLDQNEYIVLANNAFGELIGRNPSELIGLKGSELGWQGFSSPQQQKKLPWIQVLSGKKNMIGVRLTLKRKRAIKLTLIASCAPILDDKGRNRGVLVTLDNVTELEEKNQELSRVVNKLKQTTDVVQTKNEELEFLATHDPQTQLLNRRALNQRFESLFTEVQEEGGELSCVMCDIDHFKSVNDKYGHATGDKVIKSIADILLMNFRKHDLVGRYGGEEFCIVLPTISLNLAEQICNRVRKSIQEETTSGVQVTMSFGVSTLGESVSSPEELTILADQALYVAKQSGRNQVVCWGDDGEPAAAGKDIDIDKGSKENKALQDTSDSTPDSAEPGGAIDKAEEVERLTARVRELEVIAEKRSKELEHFNAYDSSTGLPTRTLFRDRVSRAIIRGERFNSIVAVLSLSVDAIQRISETLGHESGEWLLKDIGKRLGGILRSMDTVAKLPSEALTPTVSRLGYENFGILLTDIEEVSVITWIVKRIMTTLEEPFRVNEKDIHTTTNIGISIYPYDGETSEVLERNAAAAKTHATKNLGPNRYYFYSQNLQNNSVKHLSIENKLHQAIENDEFILHYQPKISTRDGAILGFEALIRLDSPESGIIAPSDFIPIAEYSGLIAPIGEWVLRAAGRQMREWIDMGLEDFCRIAVNVSNRQFRNSNLTQVIGDVLQEHLLLPENLIIEVTENSIMESVKSSMAILQEIKKMGVSIALDDFGTGYSSLGYLKNFPVSYIKIDRSFIADIEQNEQDATLVQSLIYMAHSMGLRVTAEGVETEAQVKMLYDLNCDEMQGFLFSKPVPPEAVPALIAKGVGQRFPLWNHKKAA